MKKNLLISGYLALIFSMVLVSCENDNINPYDYAAKSDTTVVQPSSDGVKTALAEYPSGSLVWTKDTILKESVEIPENVSLYIEPGITVTCSSSAKVPVEIVVLGNLYCMGTTRKPITITSDTKKPADWGGIICGYKAGEVVLNHVNIAYAGATPTESSLSFQNGLFKTQIDGGVPAFHFCNVDGRFVISDCFFHDNYNDQTYFTGGKGIIQNNIFADNGNAADGGEAINVKSGCNLDVSYNLIYNACTNAFKLSDSGNSETIPLTEIRVYNNTAVDCGWRRSKNKKGGSIWLEKGIYPTLVNNLIYDCRYGMKQPATSGCDVDKSTLVPNYYFASTQTGIDQMSATADLVMFYNSDIHSSQTGGNNPLFTNFSQNPKMDINCEVDDTTKGAPLAYNSSWNFYLQAGSPALGGGTTAANPIFADGLAFFGMKKVQFFNTDNDQNYYFYSRPASAFFGAYGQTK